MTVTYIPAPVRRLVEERADFKCEYCNLPVNVSFFSSEIDHIIPEKHGGANDESNLALTCWRCNRHKGTDLGSFDPQTSEFSLLFNPRVQIWTDHFIMQEFSITGLTPEGRTTVYLLQLNTSERIDERKVIAEIS